MKKALANTRVSVKLRKSEYREEWYLYVEAYPVFQADKPTWKIQCKLPPKTKRFCPLVLK